MTDVISRAARRRRRTLRTSMLLPALLLAAGSLGALAPAASAHSGDGSVALSSASYVAHEDQGYLTISIVRTDTSSTGQIRYGVKQRTAQSGEDFDTVPNTYAVFLPGQSTITVQVHIDDNGMNAPPVYAKAYLFGAYPETLGNPSSATVTILRDDPLQTRDDANPLGAPTVSLIGDPLQGVKFYIPRGSSAAGQAEQAALGQGDTSSARALSVLAAAPTGFRFWFWNTPADPAGNIASFLETAQEQQPGSTVQLTSYSLVHDACGSDISPAFVKRWDEWIRGYARGIGNFHVLMFFEIDSLITSPCMSSAGRRVRFVDELEYGIRTLEADPHVVVYVDAGAADALTWQTAAADLREAGVQYAQGFFLNATHFDWTTAELAYGQKISKALGGAHFVINTGENGRGPLRSANIEQDGMEVLCNPPGRGLGPWSTSTGYKGADAFIWMSSPGSSGGACGPGEPPTGAFWTAYAVSLVQNAAYTITGPAERLIHLGHFIPEQP